MTSFHARQAGLLGLTILFMLLALAGSDLFRGLLVPLVIGSAPYLNPFILAIGILYGGVGLLTLFRARDSGWPWFAALLGIWVFVIAFEDSILQWFTFQFGAQFIGGRIDPLLVTASAAAFATAILMHANQLSRRMRRSLAERGIDAEEIRAVETHAHHEARRVVVRLVGTIGAASVVLWVLQFALLRASLGLGLLGILGGLLIVAAICVMAYQVLRKGPVPDLIEVPATLDVPERRAERPSSNGRSG